MAAGVKGGHVAGCCAWHMQQWVVEGCAEVDDMQATSEQMHHMHYNSLRVTKISLPRKRQGWSMIFHLLQP